MADLTPAQRRRLVARFRAHDRDDYERACPDLTAEQAADLATRLATLKEPTDG